MCPQASFSSRLESNWDENLFDWVEEIEWKWEKMSMETFEEIIF